MADTLINTLYPPVMETFQPAFIYTDPAVITFSISPFNVASDINYVQLSIVDQRNNENVLKETSAYKEEVGIFNGILIAKFPRFTNTEGQQTSGIFVYDADVDLYSISISPDFLNQDENDYVEIEQTIIDENTIDDNGDYAATVITTKSHYYNVAQYYKVQIRFDCTTTDITTMQNTASAGDVPSAQFLANYMTEQRPYFSEWSEVTLIKPIYEPVLILSKFDTADDTLAFNKGLVRVAGTVGFNGELAYEDNEHLESYRLLLTNTSTQTIFLDTGDIYATKNPDGLYGINYLLDMESAKEYDAYNMRVFLKTNNSYETYKDYGFEIAEFYEGDFVSPTWNSLDYVNHPTDEVSSAGDLVVNQEDGIVVIEFACPKCESPGTLYIKRACSKDNFKTWQVISATKHKGNDVKAKVVDYSVCSLHSYRYAAQYEYRSGLWSPVLYSNPVYIKFYEMLLMRQNRQIAIRYNGQVSSWKPVVNRQKIDTLGGKYPKFVENAIMNYKQFAISGIISTEGDFNRKFLNEFDGEWVEQEDGSYSYKFYYQQDIQSHNDNFDSTYMIRNDTIADGEFGFHENRIKSPNDLPHSFKGNLYLGDAENDKISSETATAIKDAIFTDDEYAYSVFDDNNHALNHQHDLTMKDNWYWEREFREQLVSWLNDGEPKLYRSMPEGNIAVMLTDISLTPTMGSRQLYNFSATMYEIGDGYDLETLDSLGVVDIPKIASSYVAGADYTDNPDSDKGDDLSYVVQKVGQRHLPQVWGRDLIKGSAADNSTDEWSQLNIVEQLQEQQAGYLKNTEIIPTSLTLNDMKLTFISEPRWYQQTSDDSWALWNSEEATPQEAENLWLGYIILLNGRQIFVNSRGYYQVPSDSPVSTLTIASYDEVIVDYILSYRQQFNSGNIPKRTKLYKRIVGQYSGIFPANKEIMSEIKQKYALTEYNMSNGIKDTSSPIFIQMLQYWKGISIDVSPYAFIGITYKDDTDYETYVVGRTGVLHLLEDTPVDNITFLGRRMIPVDKERQSYLDEWECVFDESVNPTEPENTGDVNWFEFVDNNIEDTGQGVVIRWSEDNFNYPYPVYEQWLDTMQAYIYSGYDGDLANVREPKYNNVYAITKDGETTYYIYYIDDNWYPVKIFDDCVLAAVPVYGVVNYKGDLVRSEYS